MSKLLRRQISLVLSVFLMVQMMYSAAYAATNSSILPPSNLQQQMVSADDVKLTWDSVFGATGYKVYSITDGQLVDVGTVTAATYTINNLPEGSYRYVVSTLSPDGESGPSAPITVTITYPEMLPPSTVTYTTNYNDLTLTWTSVPYATNYRVYQIIDGAAVLKSTVTGTSVKYSGMAPGQYTFEVRSYNDSSGESASGTQVVVTINEVIMLPPANAAYTIKNGNDIVLSWNSAANATGYKVYQIVNGSKVLKSSPTGTTVTFTNSPAGDYTYEIHSYSTYYGESAEGSTVSFKLDPVIMAAPTNLTANLQNVNDIVLSWSSVNYANSYKVYQIVDGIAVLKSTVTGTTVSYTKMPGGDYTYEVRSFSSRFGESPQGSQVSVTVDTVDIAPPSNLTYTVKNGSDIVLTWDAVTNATSYKVYQMVNGQPVLKSTVTATSVTFTKMAPGDYTFLVYSVSTRFGDSLTGSTVSFTLDSQTMVPPATLTYTILDVTGVRLDWTSVPYATSYKVYEIVNGAPVLKSTVTGLTATYSNLSEGNHEYEVHSVSSLYGESVEGTVITMPIVYPAMVEPANAAYKIQNGNDVVLTWNASQYATSYNIYEVINGEKTLIKTVTTLSVLLSNVSAGDHQYLIHSVSSRFGESAGGSAVTLTMVLPVMAAPANVTSTIANGNDLTLKWDAVPYANSYKVYQVVGGEKILKSTVTTTSAAYLKLPMGEYVYEIHSFSNRYGESAEGSLITVVIDHQDMAAPSNLTYSITAGNNITLKWDAVTYATQYKIYQVIDGQLVLKKTVTTTTVTFTNMPEGDYTYAVYSYSDRFGDSPEGSQISFPLVFPVMQAPETISSTIQSNINIVLSWKSALYATGYNVYQIVNGEKVFKAKVSSTSATFSKMPEGDYTYVVHSYSDRFGESAEGKEISLSLVYPIMQAPTKPTYSIANGNDLTLKWTASTYANGYKVYEIIDGQRQLLKTVTTAYYTMINLPEGHKKYEVTSYNTYFGESPDSAVIELDLVWPIVQPPVITGTVFNANNITLSWPAVTWANEYRIYEVIDGNRKLLNTTTKLSSPIYNLTEDMHSFEVRAFSTRFGESQASNVITENIVYPTMQPPVATLELLSDTSALIIWDFVTYANGYNVYEIVNGNYVLIAEKVNNLSYLVSNLSYANHEYVVTSYSNSFGESEKSNTVLAKLIVDTEPPVTEAQATASWTNQSQVVTLAATDNETGVQATYYSVNGQDFVEGTSIPVTDEGITRISYYSVDKVGNKETVQTIEVKIDKTAPVTTTNAPAAWSNQAVTVQLTVSDAASGVVKTYYAINGAEYVEGAVITVDQEGVNQITYYSVDAAGNVEQAQTMEVKIDKTAPTTTTNVPTTWSSEAVTVQLIASDATSGVAKTYYAVNGAQYAEGTVITVDQEGVNQITYYSVDAAGNVEQVQTIEVKIDKTAPVISLNLDGEYALGSNLNLSYTAVDDLSGIASEEMIAIAPTGEKTIVPNNGSILLSSPGVYTVKVTAVNGAGLSTTVQKQITVYVPATIEVTPKVIKGNKGVFTVRVDLPEGYSTQGFDLATATVNGVKALNSNNGYVNQAKLGQFKFERSDFAWNTPEVTLVFRGYVDGQLVVGQKTAKVQN